MEIRMPSPRADSTFKRCPFLHGRTLRAVGRTQNFHGECLSAEGEFHEQYRTHDPCLTSGLGIGAGLAAVFVLRSGEETREWIADATERKFKVLRRRGRRSIRQQQDAVPKGEEKVTEVLRSGREALESVAGKLN